MQYWRRPEFIAEQLAWYARLKDGGFDDHERYAAGDMRLRQFAAKPLQDLDPLAVESRAAYFRLLARIVARKRFKNAVHHLILAMHADGFKAKEICATLRFVGNPRTRNSVRYIVRRYEVKWGLRDWTPQQLNKKTPRSA